MTQYRTAQGRSVDMSRLMAKNEKTRAVGNMKVNARGDVIDGQGRIIQSVNERTSQRYTNTVDNGIAKQVNTRVSPDSRPVPDPVLEERLPIEEEFDSQDDLEIEQIKQQETKPQETKKGKK